MGRARRGVNKKWNEWGEIFGKEGNMTKKKRMEKAVKIIRKICVFN